uniref:PiggyBac transposable element-derived protein domain-containing protein n=1 Tax=Nothobranchius furzeri TaxID=105023 RepID=A0A8C6M6Z2_NOTFU
MCSRKRITVREVLEQIFDSESDIEENVSETEDCVEEDPDSEGFSSDENESVDPPVVSQEPTDMVTSKNGKITWPLAPRQQQGRLNAPNLIKMVPVPTRYAISHTEDIKSSFGLFITPSIENIVVGTTNLEGKRVYGDSWKDLDVVDLEAYIGLLILAGVSESKGEATASLWKAETGRAIFPATMSLKTFQVLSCVIRFDDKQTRQGRRERDKLAAIRDVWDKWVQRLPLLYNPGPHVTVDECLVAFHGRCPFQQYMPSKPAKYGIKIWAACDAQSSFAWNMQVYKGKSPGEAPGKNQGTRVVLDMAEGLYGHNITCDNFSHLIPWVRTCSKGRSQV